MSNHKVEYALKCEYRDVFVNHEGNFIFGDVCGKNRRKWSGYGTEFCHLHKQNAYFAIKQLYDLKHKPKPVTPVKPVNPLRKKVFIIDPEA